MKRDLYGSIRGRARAMATVRYVRYEYVKKDIHLWKETYNRDLMTLILQFVAACCSELQRVAARWVCLAYLRNNTRVYRVSRPLDCSALRCVAVCCSVLQCVAARWVCLAYLRNNTRVCRVRRPLDCSALRCVAVCCSVLQCVAACCSMCSLPQQQHRCLQSQWTPRIAACCSMLQYVAVCCSVLQCVAVCRSMFSLSHLQHRCLQSQ